MIENNWCWVSDDYIEINLWFNKISYFHVVMIYLMIMLRIGHTLSYVLILSSDTYMYDSS